MTQKKINFTKRGQNSTKAARILKENKAEYQKLLKSELSKQTGKKDVCRAAKAASKRHTKMTWRQAMKKASGR